MGAPYNAVGTDDCVRIIFMYIFMCLCGHSGVISDEDGRRAQRNKKEADRYCEKHVFSSRQLLRLRRRHRSAHKHFLRHSPDFAAAEVNVFLTLCFYTTRPLILYCVDVLNTCGNRTAAAPTGPSFLHLLFCCCCTILPSTLLSLPI